MDSVCPWLRENDIPTERPEEGWGHWVLEMSTEHDCLPEPSDGFSDLLLDLDAMAEGQQSLERYLGQVEPLGKDLGQAQSAGVRIMTMGASKGLTVRATIIAGVEDGLVLRPNSDLSEERRILYVAMTRAKEYLFCTWATQNVRSGGRQGVNPWATQNVGMTGWGWRPIVVPSFRPERSGDPEPRRGWD